MVTGNVEAHPRLEEEHHDRSEAILRHELGHVVAAFYTRAQVQKKVKKPKGWKGWPTSEERYADAIAEALWRDRILYDWQDVQTLAFGTWPRPEDLG